jgi:Tfp pilus assembly protein PilX
MNRSFKQMPAAARSQSGLALLVALLVLVAMSLAGIALVRSVDTASLIAGNIAFRQGATLAGDAGVEEARKYLLATDSGTLGSNQEVAGYFATSQDALDLTGNRTPGDDSDDVKWPGTAGGIVAPACLAAKDAAGNSVCYIIHRLCKSTGTVDVSTCSTEVGKASNYGRGQGIMYAGERYGPQGPTIDPVGPPMAYYRVTVRIVGPRNNTSFVQVYLLI